MNTRMKNSKGVTLVELVISVAILAIVVAGIITVLSTSLKTYNLDYNTTVGQQNLRAAMVQISRDMRNPANAAAVSGTALTLNGKSFTVSSGKLTCNGVTYATGVGSIAAGYADAAKQVIQVDLTSTDGGMLSTRVSLK